MRNQKCKRCGYFFEETQTIEGDKNFKNGDISFCFGCGEIGEFRNKEVIPIDEKTLSPELILEIARIRDVWQYVTRRGA